MTVAAFHLGLKNKLSKLKELMDNDLVLYDKGYNATELRKLMVKRAFPDFLEKDELYSLLENIFCLSEEGLKGRQCGEEKYLTPLFERIEKRTNPALDMPGRTDEGEDIEEVIKEYSLLK